VPRTPEVAARAAAQAAKALPRKATPNPAAPRDTAQTNASRGTEGSTSSAQSAAAGADRQQAAGTAAASNYPGQVQRRIARQRLPRVRAQGVAQVSFTIAPGGSLASIGLARSSGSAELDREAVNLVRRAAPFPPPPQGAQRSFTIPVRAR
jgi:protein TonB